MVPKTRAVRAPRRNGRRPGSRDRTRGTRPSRPVGAGAWGIAIRARHSDRRSQSTRRAANDEVERLDVARHHAPHADHAPASDRETTADRRAGSDARALFDARFQRVLVGSGVAQRAHRRIRAAWVTVVGEDRPGSHHHTVGDGDAGRHVDHRVELHEVADDRVGPEVGLLADDAVASDPRAATRVHAGPHDRAATDLDTGLDVGGGVDTRVWIAHEPPSPGTQARRRVKIGETRIRRRLPRPWCRRRYEPVV